MAGSFFVAAAGSGWGLGGGAIAEGDCHGSKLPRNDSRKRKVLAMACEGRMIFKEGES